MKGFKNVTIYKENVGLVKSSIQFENGKISSFEDGDDLLSLDDKLIVVPGFIDEHIHGANGSDVMYATDKDLSNVAKSITMDGVTSFVPTTMSMDIPSIKKALNVIGNYSTEACANVIGAPVEGPFISTKSCGAQDPKNIIKNYNYCSRRNFFRSNRIFKR